MTSISKSIIYLTCSGGVVIYFDRIEVVNILDASSGTVVVIKITILLLPESMFFFVKIIVECNYLFLAGMAS